MKENKKGLAYNWKEWFDKSEAMAVPGAVEFLKYAKSKGIDIFYISNRDTTNIKNTLYNLKKLCLPDIDLEHLMLRSNTHSKKLRRSSISEKYDVIMLLGDNLNDFDDIFQKQSNYKKSELAEQMKSMFGKKFIVLPNAMYGDWLNGLYNYQTKLTLAQKDSFRLKLLEGY